MNSQKIDSPRSNLKADNPNSENDLAKTSRATKDENDEINYESGDSFYGYERAKVSKNKNSQTQREPENLAKKSKTIQFENDVFERSKVSQNENNWLLNNFHKTTSQTKTIPTKADIRAFKNSLISYNTQLNKIKEEVQNSSSSIKAYETSSEARRRAQLKTEETIADLKMLHGFDINDDESVLPTELQLEIESIQKKNDSLIEQTESYEQTLISESESSVTKAKVTKIITELDKKIKLAKHWTKIVDSDRLKEEEQLIKAKNELNHFSLKEIKEKINLLPFNAKKMDFIESNQNISKSGNEQKIGQIKIVEKIGFEDLKIFKFCSGISNSTFTYPSRLFEVMDNGTYVAGGYLTSSKKFHLFTYDPIKKTKKQQLIFDQRIDEIFTFKNRIALSQRRTEKSQNYILKIMDENLNLIKETNTNAILKSVDDSKLYCISDQRELVLFDWDLNKLETNVVFQYEDSNKKFYLKPDHMNYLTRQLDSKFSKINQLVKRDNKYILNFKTGGYQPPNKLLIFNETGVLLKEKDLRDDFVIDSNNNIIVDNIQNKLFYHYDLNGNLLKTVTLNSPLYKIKHLKLFKIDSTDKLYFTL